MFCSKRSNKPRWKPPNRNSNNALNGDQVSPSDEELACRAQAGSLPAFEQLVLRHQPRLLRFLRHKTSSREDAEDLTQQVFITCHRQLHRYLPRHKFVTWLFTIARRHAIAYYRSRPNQDPPVCEPVGTQDPSCRMDETETEQTLWTWVQTRLSERQFTAFWLRVHEEFSIQEIARAMSLTQIHVKVLLFRSRQILAQAWPPPESRAIHKPLPSRSHDPGPQPRNLELKTYAVLSL
jgi:RNA polymerase sigma-70 factor, ECF subfamily